MNADELIEQAIGENGEGSLSPEQAARILDGVGTPGDTATAETGNAPGVTTADPKAGGNTEGTKTDDGAAAATAGTVDESQLNAQNARVLAKDGVHTISYDKLVEARTQAQEANARLAQAQAELVRLQEEARARSEAGQQATPTDKLANAAQAAVNAGADISIFGDFSEEAIAAGIQKVVQAQVNAQVQAQMAQVGEALKPLQASQQQAATNAHLTAIYTAHPDADSIAESKEFSDWVNAQPSKARDAYKDAMETGTATEINEIFSAFKAATGSNTQQAATATAGKTAEEIAAAAKAKIAGTRAAPPASLTEIPAAGVQDAGNPFATIDAMSPAAQAEAVARLSPDQLQAFLNRTL